MTHVRQAPVMIDLSAERCARSVRALASMSRRELEAFLEATARASGAVVVARTTRARGTAVPRTPRHLLRRR